MSRYSPSIVEYFAEHEKHRCGYCKSPDTNFSHGLWAHTLTVQDYQDLIDRGWRRSGKYCYKPTMDQTCCPMYTIKCDALDFKISTSQKKILKKMSKSLKDDLKRSENADRDESIIQGDAGCMEQADKALKNVTDIDLSLVTDTFDVRLTAPKSSSNPDNVFGVDNLLGTVKQARNLTPTSCSSSKEYKLGAGLDKSKPPPKKAKLMRLERKQNKLLSTGKAPTEISNIFNKGQPFTAGKTLEELFNEENTGDSKLEIKLVRVASEEFLDTFDSSAEVYRKYQMAIHQDPPEECDRLSFTNFLANSPLQQWAPADGPPQGYGSFHQQYWLNDKLIAVGVIDILPSCISSVYFFYDPIYSHLSLGTYGSLREVWLTRQLYKVVPSLKYYYMGFYIHTCPKMRYKAKMCPSKLLCPETYVWCDIENCLPKLDKEKYSRLNEDIDAVDENISNDISQVLIFYNRRVMPYYIYKQQAHRSDDEDEVREYAALVGKKCAQNLLLHRS
ncbi:arginyl-tRNA--protein transferase 1 isoform X2 [Athalia rosae]|uniref:arginyl-tRNA--protein transferase 1 isoform X2 n=1 Tax=Athalia rosae TaxID=37344 RepID=UPI0020345CF3|nr:arginyl-tRNA--protein transferase 1 isoform X2 [Athalia rosae]